MSGEIRRRKVCPHCYWRKPIGSYCGCSGEKVERRAKGFWAKFDRLFRRSMPTRGTEQRRE